MIVETCWGSQEVSKKPYWHLVPEKGVNAMMFYNNVRVGKGALLSVSACIKAEPHLENGHTPYSLHNMKNKKEALFEQVRINQYPTRPPRLKSIYLFDDYSLVEKAVTEWFPNERKSVYECRILTSAVIHKVDTNWLNCNQNDWEACAEKYWSGLMSNRPFPEILVDGAIYFPNYESFPEPTDLLA